jgi:hypothetical protein
MSLEADGTWFCRTCHSLNRREANRCYSCRMAKDSAGRQTPGQPAGSPGVPVMAESIARSAGRPRGGPRIPVTAARIARSSGKAAGATVALATAEIAPAAPKVAVLAPEHVDFAVQPETAALVSVCPFLGLRADPRTRYDFPQSANLCHSASRRGGGSVAFFPRTIAAFSGTKRPQPIGLEHQASFCLTTAHETCARYRTVKGVAANR